MIKVYIELDDKKLPTKPIDDKDSYTYVDVVCGEIVLQIPNHLHFWFPEKYFDPRIMKKEISE